MRTSSVMVAVLVSGCSVTNHPPQIQPVTATGREDLGTRVTVVVTDEDGDDLDLRVDSDAHVVDIANRDGGTRVEIDVSYRPGRNQNGEMGFTAHVSDGGEEVREYIPIFLEPVNDFPTRVTDSFAASVDTPLVLAAWNLLANDVDVDLYDEDPVPQGNRVSAVGAAVNGTVALVGTTITFTPDPGYSGTARFEYTVDDGEYRFDGDVVVAVGGPNTAPAALETVAGTFGGPIRFGIGELYNSDIFDLHPRDLDGHTVWVTAVSNPTNGTVTLADGVITFSLDPRVGTSFPRPEGGFDYTLTDGAATTTAHAIVKFQDVIF